MNCEGVRELLPDVASGAVEATPEVKLHLESCGECAETLKAMEQTMALLDEWEAPEPSAYWDTRMMARLREEQAKGKRHWYAWLMRPAAGVAFAMALVFGVGSYVGMEKYHERKLAQNPVVERGTAVGDLQALDKDSELLNTYAALDDDDDDDTATN